MERLPGREQVKKFAKCSLRRGDIELPSPMSPYDACSSRCVGTEELLGLMFDELTVSRYPLDPARQTAIGIEVDFRLARKAEVVRQALQLECAATADVHGFVEETLERDNHALPRYGLLDVAGRPLIDTTDDTFEPALRHVLFPPLPTVAVFLQPSGINHQPLGEKAMKLVYLIVFLTYH